MPLILICHDNLTIFYLPINSVPILQLYQLRTYPTTISTPYLSYNYVKLICLSNYILIIVDLLTANQSKQLTLVKRVFIIILDFLNLLHRSHAELQVLLNMIFRKHVIIYEIINFYKNSCNLVNKTMRTTDAKINLKHLADF